MMRGRAFVAAVLALGALAGCGGPLELLTGGGPNVAANVQAGAENTQGARVSDDTAQRTGDVSGGTVSQSADEKVIRTERVETQTIVQNERVPAWIWLLVLVGWLLDSPRQMLANWRKRRGKGGALKWGAA